MYGLFIILTLLSLFIVYASAFLSSSLCDKKVSGSAVWVGVISASLFLNMEIVYDTVSSIDYFFIFAFAFLGSIIGITEGTEKERIKHSIALGFVYLVLSLALFTIIQLAVN